MRQFKEYLKLIISDRTLAYDEAKDFQNLILKNEFVEKDLIAVFKALENRPLSFDEFKGFYEASKIAMIKIGTELETLDTCGTGGDQSGSFNISTTAAIICSAVGVPVAKHGNRAASSQCGSADVLEGLGLNIDLTKQQAEECLRSCGFVFLLAKNFHPAFRFAAPARKIYGKKTYFNLLGPLLNPADAEYRVHGLSDASQAEILGKLLIESGVKRAWLIHSKDGLDEISPASPTQVWEFKREEGMKTFSINPDDFGFPDCELEKIIGGDIKENAKIIKNILNQTANPSQTAAAILNAAAGLTVYGRTESLERGIEIAKEILNSGQALGKLQQIQAVCQKIHDDGHPL